MKFFHKIVVIICCAIYTIVINFDFDYTQETLKAIFFDVGQGDSLLLLTPDSKSILIDAGKDISAASKLGEYLSGNIIDLLIITHPDTDHIAGVFDIKKGYQINNTIAEQHELLSGLSRLEVNEGGVIVVGCCVQLKLFNVDNKDEDANARSYAILVSYANKEIFVAGDLPKNLEDTLVNQIGDIEVLKVGHHGSNTSTSKYFLDTVKPEVAIISVGENKYGHPHFEVLNNLNNAGVQTYRTDQLGDIEIIFSTTKKYKIYSK